MTDIFGADRRRGEGRVNDEFHRARLRPNCNLRPHRWLRRREIAVWPRNALRNSYFRDEDAGARRPRGEAKLEKVLASVELILSKSSVVVGTLWGIAGFGAGYVRVSRKKKSTAMNDRFRYSSHGYGHSQQANESADQHNSTQWSPSGYQQGYGSPDTGRSYQPYGAQPVAPARAPRRPARAGILVAGLRNAFVLAHEGRRNPRGWSDLLHACTDPIADGSLLRRRSPEAWRQLLASNQLVRPFSRASKLPRKVATKKPD